MFLPLRIKDKLIFFNEPTEINISSLSMHLFTLTQLTGSNEFLLTYTPLDLYLLVDNQ